MHGLSGRLVAGRGQVRFRLGFYRDLPKEVGSARMQLGSSLGADGGAAQGQARGRSVSGRGSGWGQLGGSLGGSSWADRGSSGPLGDSLLLWKPGSHFDAETYKKCSQAKMEKVLTMHILMPEVRRLSPNSGSIYYIDRDCPGQTKVL